MSTLKKRSRVALAVATATLSTASMFALATPAHAAAVAPDPVEPPITTPVSTAPTAKLAAGKITVDWEASATGEPADSYVVVFTDNSATPVVTPVVVAAPTTVLVWADGVAGKTYTIQVFAHNPYGSSAPRATTPATIAIPLPPDCTIIPLPVGCPVPPPIDTRAYRPFNNWDALIKQEYQDWVGRAPRLDELTFWRYVLTVTETGNYYTDPQGRVITDGRVQLVTSLAEEAEQTDGPAYRLYTAYFHRNPDFGGLMFWSSKLRTGWSLLQVSNFFVHSSEFKNTYGEYETNAPEGPKTDAAEFVALVYANVLDRAPDGSGFSFWTRQLQSERKSPAEVLIGFSEAPEFKNKMAVRVGAGMLFAHELRRMPTNGEYTLAEFFNEFFSTTPLIDGQGIWVGADLYISVIDSAPYIARVNKG